MENIDIIIARYNEDLKWTLEEPFNKYKYIVYNKGINENFEKKNISKIINLNNVGREGHTYLYHIVSNYDNLNNIIVFFPGSIDMVEKKKRAAEILNRIENNNYNKAIFMGEYCNDLYDNFKNFKLDNWCCSNKKNIEINNENKLQISHIRPFGYWYLYYFGNKKVNFFCYWGIFSIDKRDIIQHPIQRYICLLNQLKISSNPEIGHYTERSWCAIFHPVKYTKLFI